jgi:hypothetical protein
MRIGDVHYLRPGETEPACGTPEGNRSLCVRTPTRRVTCRRCRDTATVDLLRAATSARHSAIDACAQLLP